MIQIALLDPKIPQNTGNIARLAVGLDIPLILIGKLGFSLSDKYLKRAGLDYWDHLKLNILPSLSDLYSNYSRNRIVFATTKGKNSYFDFNFKKDDIILFGSETKGLPEDLIMNNMENTITIPMPGKVRSINLSNSVSVITYHALHKLGYFDNFNVNENYTDLINRNK